MDTTLSIVPDQKMAISVRDVSLEWVTKPDQPVASKKKHGKHDKHEHAVERDSQDDQFEPFKITALNMAIPRGQLTAICGPVGSGSESNYHGSRATLTYC
jgi:ABC-type transport system involved in cytochrome bd biosynthesis fused ATPase/permease subunit